MSDAYTDATTTVAWFVMYLLFVTIIGFIGAALMGRIEAAYKATLMEIHERRQRNNGKGPCS